MSRSLSLLLVVLMLAAVTPRAVAEDRPAMKSKGWIAFYRGDYKTAAKAFDEEFAKSPDDLAVVLGINRLRLETGDYDGAEKSLTEYLTKHDSLMARRLLVRVYFIRGRRDLIQRQITEVQNKDAESSFARVTRALLLEQSGKLDEAEEAYQQVMDAFWSAPDLLGDDKADPDMLYDVAVAGVRIGTRAGDSGTLQTVVDQIVPAITQRDKYYYDAYLLEAFLYLEKGNPLDASKTFKQVTDFNKYHPEARLGMAIYSMQKYALDEAEREVGRALKINPNLPGAMQAQATLALFDEEFDAAETALQKALRINPTDIESLSLLGALHQYRGDTSKYQAVEKQVLALNPRCSTFYHRVGTLCLRTLRFLEAEPFLRKAVELDAHDWSARSTLGMALLHQGREKDAYEELNNAFEKDSFQAEAYNTLQLFDHMKEEFVDHEEGKWVYRFDKKEEPVMLPYLTGLIREADATLGKKYEIDPEGPILIEMFPKYKDFSVRTAGVVGIGALGACFGKVCTLLSPKGQEQFGVFNWSRTAWHEYAHVVTLQKSKGRVPRWLTEGLSVYEEKQHRADWAREMDLELLYALRRGQTLGLGELNRGFTRPKFPEQVLLCYFQASLVCEYIVEKQGFAAIVAMLTAYAKGLRTPEVVQEVLKQDLTTFDQGFFAWLEARLSALKLPPVVSDDEKARLEEAVSANAKDAKALGRLAWYHLQSGNPAEAKTLAERAETADPTNADALTVLGYLASEAGQRDAAIAKLEAALKAGADYYGAHVRLGALYKETKRTADAIAQFEAAKRAYPNRADKGNNPYAFLAAIYEAEGKKDEMVKELEALRAIDQDDSDVRLRLGDHYLKAGKPENALAVLRQANEIHPLGDAVHTKMAQALRALKKSEEAAAEFEVAIGALQANNKRGSLDEKIANLYCDMAEMALENQDFDGAERHVDDALYLFPKLERGLALQKTVEKQRK